MSILQTFKGKLLKTMTIRGLNQIKLNLIPSFTGSNATLFNPDIFMILNTLYFDFFIIIRVIFIMFIIIFITFIVFTFFLYHL